MGDSPHSRLTDNKSERVTVRLESETRSDIEALVEMGEYHNHSVLIREAVTDLVEEHREAGDLPSSTRIAADTDSPLTESQTHQGEATETQGQD